MAFCQTYLETGLLKTASLESGLSYKNTAIEWAKCVRQVLFTYQYAVTAAKNVLLTDHNHTLLPPTGQPSPLHSGMKDL